MCSSDLQLSYAIRVKAPTSIHIESFGTHRCDLRALERWVREIFPVEPNFIIAELGLRRPIYQPTASYGHFGHAHYPWEQLDLGRIEALQAFSGVNKGVGIV